MTTDPAVLAEKIEAINEARSAESAGPNYNVAPTTTITPPWSAVTTNPTTNPPGESGRCAGG